MTLTLAIAQSVRHLFAAGLETRQLAWLGLAVLTVLVGRLSVNLPLPHCRLSFSDAFIFLSVLVFGSDLGMLTAALDGYAATPRVEWAATKRAFNTTGMAVSVFLSSRVFARLLPQGGLWGPDLSVFQVAAAVTALVLVQYLINTALVATVVTLKERASLLVIWQESSPWAGAAHLAAALGAVGVFFAVRDLGTLSAFAILPVPVLLYLSNRACLKRRIKVKGTT